MTPAAAESPRLHLPECAPTDGSQFIAWGIDEHGGGFNEPADRPRWAVIQWCAEYEGGKPYWRWSVPGRSSSIKILGWLPLPWNDDFADYALGREVKE